MLCEGQRDTRSTGSEKGQDKRQRGKHNVSVPCFTSTRRGAPPAPLPQPPPSPPPAPPHACSRGVMHAILHHTTQDTVSPDGNPSKKICENKSRPKSSEYHVHFFFTLNRTEPNRTDDSRTNEYRAQQQCVRTREQLLKQNGARE